MCTCVSLFHNKTFSNITHESTLASQFQTKGIQQPPSTQLGLLCDSCGTITMPHCAISQISVYINIVNSVLVIQHTLVYIEGVMHLTDELCEHDSLSSHTHTVRIHH